MLDPFESGRRQLYDKIRRATLSSPTEFDGPNAKYRAPSHATISPLSFEESRSDVGKDAFYESVHDLQSEGVVFVRNGEIFLRQRQQRSDRGVDAPLDHARAGRIEREVPIEAGNYGQTPCLIAVDSMPSPLRDCVDTSEFDGLGAIVLYSRTIHVRPSSEAPEEIWALTYSAIRPGDVADPKDFASCGVFKALEKGGLRPVRRMETLLVRFPYSEERTLLGLSDELWRLPVIVAVGKVFASGNGIARPLCVEQYVNIMRADRYIIQNEVAIHD